MPGFVRIGASARRIWEYATRLLTSLATPDDIVKFLGKGTGTEVPANKSLYDLIALDRLDHATYGLNALRAIIAAGGTLIATMEHEIGFPSPEALDDIALGGDQTTTERTITVALPSGASRVRVALLAFVTVMNNTATAHKINIKVQGRKNPAAVPPPPFTDFFDENEVVGFGAVDGATTSLVAVQDVTALVDEAATYGFRLTVNQGPSPAHDFSVHYTTQYVLIITYRMS